MKDLNHHKDRVQKKVLKSAKKESNSPSIPILTRKDQAPKIFKTKPKKKNIERYW